MDSIYYFYLIIYFILGLMYVKENKLVGACFVSVIMTGITIYLWWLACIILFVIGSSLSAKYPSGKGTIMTVTVVLIILTAVAGIRARNQIKEEQTAKERQQQEFRQRAEQESNQEREQENKRNEAQNDLIKCKNNLKSIGTALEMYSADHSGRYPSGDWRAALVTGDEHGYLKTIPACPAAGKETYIYTSTTEPDIFTVYCSGHHHSYLKVEDNYPQFNSARGLIENAAPQP